MMAPWSTADIPDLTGSTAVVTGANIGLGFETAVALAGHGAAVIMACRDEGRCRSAVQRLRHSAPDAMIEPMLLDLADLDSVRAFAQQVAGRHDAIDILMNNAGVLGPPVRHATTQGFELQLGVNHLGHFALTGLLLPLLARASGSRIVTVSSLAHESGRIDFEDLQQERDYTPYAAYCASKLANVLFMRELDRRLRAAGADILSVGAHPGLASTNMQASGPFLGKKPLRSWLILAAVRVIGQSAKLGAEPQLYAATAGGVEGGDYYGPALRTWGHPAPAALAPHARDDAAASRLWDISKQLTGVDIDSVLAQVASPAAR